LQQRVGEEGEVLAADAALRAWRAAVGGQTDKAKPIRTLLTLTIRL